MPKTQNFEEQVTITLRLPRKQIDWILAVSRRRLASRTQVIRSLILETMEAEDAIKVNGK